MTGKKAHPVVAKDTWTRHLRKQSLSRPVDTRSTPPMVTWRATPCNCWVLRVYLTPEGWALDGRDFKVPMNEWIARIDPDGTREAAEGVSFTLENYRAGKFAAFNPGGVNGIAKLLPLDVGSWEHAKFEVGCNHQHDHRPLDDLADDCLKVRETRGAVTRRIEW